MQVLRNFRRTALTMVEVMALEKRDREEEMELDTFIQEANAATSTNENPTSVGSEVVGRQTGTAEWKAARGEDGTRQ